MSWFAGLIPPLGGGLFIGISGAALFGDRALIKAARGGKPTFLRSVSQATADPRRSPHWRMLAAVCIYASTITAAAIWQQTAVEVFSWTAVATAIGSGTALFLMAIAPNFEVSTSGGVWHVVTAGVGMALGLNYTMTSAFLAQGRGDNTLFVFRLVIACVGFAACAFMLFGGLYIYFAASKEMQKARKEGPPLTAERETTLLKRMSLVGWAEAIIGWSMGVSMATATSEANQLETSQWPLGGLVGLAVLVFTAHCSSVAFCICGHNRMLSPEEQAERALLGTNQSEKGEREEKE